MKILLHISKYKRNIKFIISIENLKNKLSTLKKLICQASKVLKK